MSQPTPLGPPIEPMNAVGEQPGAPLPPATQPDEQLPMERSKFSRWLASFGLGETQIPLLRPQKPPHSGGR